MELGDYVTVCPLCKKLSDIPYIMCSKDFDEVDENDSDGYGWASITFSEYVMCPYCRGVYDIFTGNNGKSTKGWLHEPVLPKENLFDKLSNFAGRKKRIFPEKRVARKKIVKKGIELYEKARQLEERRADARCSILLNYVWEIERMEKDMKESYLVSYHESISEILDILEKENNVKSLFEPGLEVYKSSEWDEKTKTSGEIVSRTRINYRSNETKLLLMAEFYRRKGMFRKAITVLDGYIFKTPGHYQEIADGIVVRSKNKIPDLFHLQSPEIVHEKEFNIGTPDFLDTAVEKRNSEKNKGL